MVGRSPHLMSNPKNGSTRTEGGSYFTSAAADVSTTATTGTTAITTPDTITVDFSAKGGPSNMVGEWDPEVPGIKWADGNTWTWLRALESEGGDEGEEEGEAQGGSDAGDGRRRRRLRSALERRRLEVSSNSTNDETDTSAGEEVTPATSPTATPTSPKEDEVMASLNSIPGNYSDPDHPGCGEFGSTSTLYCAPRLTTPRSTMTTP